MPVALLRGENFRLYRNFEIQPHPGLNLFTGDNAAGKTTLLESLFVAARGKSFRAGTPAELAGSTRPGWSVFLESRPDVGAEGLGHRVGVGWSKEGGTSARLDDSPARLADIVRALPLQLIDPLAHRLLDEGPAYRRSYLDWGVFHVEHRFHEVWRRFVRGLQQRNRALREEADDRTVQAWNEELSSTADELTTFRQAHVEAIAPRLTTWSDRLLGGEIKVELQRGWPAGEAFRETLDRNLAQHRRLGTTAQGPHRAELRIDLKSERAKNRASRGQQKLIVTAMLLAQSGWLIESGGSAPILLLDDFTAELSPESQSRLASALLDYPGQKFITSFEKPTAFSSQKSRRFHVEQGTIAPVDGPA